jgi:hypothetical protein
MNWLRIIALLSLLNAGRAGTGGLVDTNQMPLPLHDLMETAGHVLVQTNLVLAPPDTNSLRNLPPIPKSRLMVFQPITPKTPWSFWDSANVKYVGWNRDLLNSLAPAHLVSYTTLAQFEYDLAYSFDF